MLVLQRTENLCVCYVLRFQVLSSHGISHRHCLFHHYFVNYNEVFSSKIGTLVVVVRNVAPIGNQLKFGVSCSLINAQEVIP